MKHTLIPTNTLEIPIPEYKMMRGVPWSISITERDGYWYSKWQVTCHYPSPTGDASDWCSFEIGCLNKEQALNVASAYAGAFNIPDNRIKVQNLDGTYSAINGDEYIGRID